MTDHLGRVLASATLTCTVCSGPMDSAHARGMCGRCYRRTRKQAIKAGTFAKLDRSRPLIDRLLEKAAAGPNGCIIWTAHVNNKGYGRISAGGRDGGTVYAHRAAYEQLVGPIPNGMLIDHRCHNEDSSCAGGLQCLHRRCINPYHLEPVSPLENQHRSTLTPSARNATKAHCENGHAFDGENTYIRPDTGGRQCKQCSRNRGLARRASGGAR